MTNHTEREHALLGGSTANRWLECTASVALSKGIKQKESAAASAGTAAHEVAEMCLNDFIESKLKGTDPDIRAHLLSKDDDMYEAAQGWVKVLWEKVFQEAVTGKYYGLEEKFTLNEKLSMSGFIDFWCAYTDDSGKRAGAICDFKYGYVSVPVEKNPQLAFYACAMQEEFIELGKPCDYIRGIIFQPKSGGFKETKFTKKQLQQWRAKFLRAAEDIFVTKKTKFKVGDHCRFCPAGMAMRCDVYKTHVQKNTALSVVDVETDLEIPDVKTVPDETLVNIILNEDKLKSFIKAAKAYIIERHARGKKLKGLKLIRGGTKRRWVETPKDADIKRLKKLIPSDNIYESSLLGIGKIEKLLKTAKVDPKQREKVMAPLTFKPLGALNIVSSSDKGEEIASNVSLLKSLGDEDENDND